MTTRDEVNRVGFTPAEFAAKFGHHAAWAYRLLYAQKIRAITGAGRLLIPQSELDRLLGTAELYNPQPARAKRFHPRKVKTADATPRSVEAEKGSANATEKGIGKGGVEL